MLHAELPGTARVHSGGWPGQNHQSLRRRAVPEDRPCPSASWDRPGVWSPSTRERRRILQYPTLLMLMADAKPFWSVFFHSLTLTDREDYEYRRGSIYKNISAMYRIKDEG